MKKSILVLLLVAALVLPLAAMAEDAAYSDAPYHTTDLPQTDENYYAELDLAELWNWKQIRLIAESWKICSITMQKTTVARFALQAPPRNGYDTREHFPTGKRRKKT